MHLRTNFCTSFGGTQALWEPDTYTAREGRWAPGLGAWISLASVLSPPRPSLPSPSWSHYQERQCSYFISYKRSLSHLAPGKNIFWLLLSSYPAPSLTESDILICFGRWEESTTAVGKQVLSWVGGERTALTLRASMLEEQRSLRFISDAPPHPLPIRDPHRICLEKVSCLEPAGYF